MEKRRPSGTVRFLRVLTILLMLGCIAVGAYIALRPAPVEVETPPETATFAQGVSVEGVSLAGKDLDEAATLLMDMERRIASEIEFVLHAQAGSFTLTQADMPLMFHTEAVLDEALKIGNIGTRAQRLAQREALRATPVDMRLVYTVDEEALRRRVRELAEDTNFTPTDATVEMDVNVKGFFKYTEGVPGQSLDEATLISMLLERVQSRSYGEIALPLIPTEPEITVEELRASLVLRGRAETSFKKSPYNREDRVFNVKKAAGLVNGIMIKPGEVFSTNDTLGPRTYELGWKPAPAYVSGATEDQAGGGVCQVSSTLYQAAVHADLEIVSRRNHSSPVGYASGGFDATINTGTIDFKFKNNTDHDIYIFAYAIDSKDSKVPNGMADKSMHVEMYGASLPDEYDEIRITSEKLETLKPQGEKEVIVDTTKASNYRLEEVARKDGSVWQSYKHYYKNGVEVKNELLAKSTYKAYAGRVIVGPNASRQPDIPVIAP